MPDTDRLVSLWVRSALIAIGALFPLSRHAAAQGPAPTVFSVACNPSNLSVVNGGSIATTCTVTSTTNFSAAVALSCLNLPANVSCVFSPPSVTPPAGGSVSSVLTVSAGTASPGTYTFQVQGANGSTLRKTDMTLHVTAASATTVFFDNFETDKGWIVNFLGTDTATAGLWERGDPWQVISNGTVTQLGTTVSGTNDLVTGRLAGILPGDFDVDGGTTSITSPPITLPGSGPLQLSFSYYFAHLNNATSADAFKVRVMNFDMTTVFQETGAPTTDPASFTQVLIPLVNWAGVIRIQFEVTDGGTGSLIEAAVDDVKVKVQ